MIGRGRQFSSWGIFLADCCIVLFSLMFAYLLRFNFEIPEKYIHSFRLVVPIVFFVRVLTFIFFRTYAGLIRYTSSEDAQKIFIAVLTGSLALSAINLIYFSSEDVYVVPYSILIMESIFTVFFMTAFRLFSKILYHGLQNTKKEKNNVVIYGAGEAGAITIRTLARDAGMNYQVLAFIDDNPKLAHKRIQGIDILPPSEFDRLLEEKKVDQLIISIMKISPKHKQEIIEKCLEHKVKVLQLPPVQQWINGELSFKQIKQVNIDDLLEREPIKLNLKNISAQLNGKRILITGGAGSIGSELVRQILRFSPAKVFVLDQSESPLYDLETELTKKFQSGIFETVIADVRNAQRMERVFEYFKPEIVYHTAAYKHVPMMEVNPSESILTNILGTQICADLSVKYGVEKFVLVSTDKAVNPTSVMGASKRIAEMYVQSLDRKINREDSSARTHFITTRFGNVLGSQGSVIPHFKKQIEQGGPITVTHPDVTRFFMTIPEACQLVLEAGAMGEGGEIFIFDMGESVKIIDLAKKMITLSGLELGKDISIVITGMRPGEKLYEELLTKEENTIPTHHEKIMIAKVREYEYEEVKSKIESLLSLFGLQKNEQIVAKMKEIVPEYVSNNSEFEMLDQKS